MALVHADRVWETSTSVGTGTYALAGAVAGYQSFAVVGNLNTCYYTATNGTDWEVGIGLWSTGGNLDRDTILASSNGGAAVSWAAGTKQIFLGPPASKYLGKDDLSLLHVADRTALKAVPTTFVTAAILKEAGREGTFIWRSGDYSAEVTADTEEGLYVEADAVASTSGAWVRQRNSLTVNVKWFGATGDGSTDNTDAFAGALAMLTTSGALYAPSGKYALSSGTLAKTLATGQSLRIYGDGDGETIFYFASNGTGLSITYATTTFAWISGSNVIVEDLSFVTNVQNTGAALKIDGNSTIGNPNRPTVISRVCCRGTVNNSSYWLVGLHITDVQNMLVLDCSYFGYTTGLVGTVIFYTGTSDTEHPTVLNVRNFNMQFGEFGVRVTGYIEGVNVLHSNFTQVANGVAFTSTPGNLPQCSICDCQIWASSVGISTNATASQITGNLIFMSGSAYAILGTPVYSTIVGNTFIGQSGSPNGVVLQSGGTYNLIADNVFKGFVTNIWLQSGANNNSIGVNSHANGTPLVDSGTTNKNVAVDAINFVINGGGSVLTTGFKGFLVVPFSCTITNWTLLGDVSGSIVVNVWKDTYANHPPVSSDKITASAPPTISSATKGQSSTLTGWTTALAKGDILAFNVDSVTSIKSVVLSLQVIK